MVAWGDEDPLITEALGKHSLEYLRCPVCGKPLKGFLVRNGSELAVRIKDADQGGRVGSRGVLGGEEEAWNLDPQ
jgi:translation initiation factor 2 beta subunit (eIF-2beta)/eIF-5